MTSKRVLITSLSVSPKITRYKLMEIMVESNQSPLALMQLLPQEKRPERILVLCSERIFNEQFSNFKADVQNAKQTFAGQDEDSPISVESLLIPDGVSTEELWQSIKVILEAVPEGCGLTIDLTHGYRSIPFLIFTAALYLRTLKNVQIAGVYYGMLEENTGEKHAINSSVLIDMSVLINMIEWFYAAKIFSETGQAKFISELLAPFSIPPEGQACSPYSKVKELQEKFQNMGAAYLQALPLEAGLESSLLLKQLEKALPEHLSTSIPLPDELFGKVKEFIVPFKLDNRRQYKDKRNLILNEQELKRQGLMIDSYMEQGYVNHSIGLMREWMVSAAMYQTRKHSDLGSLKGDVWLSYDAKAGDVGRKDIEFKLGACFITPEINFARLKSHNI
ncbi:MAG: TIGR02221 family CRISPR-associated protein [Desulfitobacteriaceae bacterium]|nr:TIGR02221 family CRISPR-associated protein [Desulfitobacteriaceae bacterium]